MDWKTVINHIPKGRKNAISRAMLQAATGLNDRANRQAIETARRNGIMVVSNSGGKGYYIADNDDEWLLFLEEHRRRALNELTTYNEGIKLLSRDYVVARVIPVKAHIRHLKADLPCDGQMTLEERYGV